MSHVPAGLRYTTEHEYLKEANEPDVFFVGITDYAQGELGDVVYVELPEPGDIFAEMDSFGTIEAVKAVSDLYCPLSGEIVAINEALDDDPGRVNSDPYGEGWMIQLRVDDPSEVERLMDSAGYGVHIDD